MKKSKAIRLVLDEFITIDEDYEPLHSPHEGYGLLLEEVDELWDEVKKKGSKRSKKKMASEVKQIAALAIRFLKDLC